MKQETNPVFKIFFFSRQNKTTTFINITFNNSKNSIIFIKNINFNIMEPKFIGKARLTKQGQLTLPQEGRKDLKIDSKSDVYWYEFNDVLVLVKEVVNPKEIIDFVLKKRKK